MDHKRKNLIFIWILILAANNAFGQENIFSLFKDDAYLADQYFANKDYKKALDLYLQLENKARTEEIHLKIGRSFFHLKQYKKAAEALEKIKFEKLKADDLYMYSELHTTLGNYPKALVCYQAYLAENPDNDLILKKIWRLNNIKYLLEDSAYFEIRKLTINSGYSDFGAAPYKNGIIFSSNRKEVSMIDHIDVTTGLPFYKMYKADYKHDSLQTSENDLFYTPTAFGKSLGLKLHTGSISLYNNESKMVFSASDKEGTDAGTTMQLYFAEYKDNEWTISTMYPFNSKSHSLTNPSITEDGNVLYFASDMKGGFGGKDIYRSEYKEGKWTKPVNMGGMVNTPYDETFPYFYEGGILYFSSNGHPGMGGLDIFRINIYNDGSEEIENMGYPLNSGADDFGIVVDTTNTTGYFSSNRENGGFDDNLYAFDMDLQQYPLKIAGVIKYVEHSWTDSSELKILPHVRLVLMDNNRDIAVAESTSDSSGAFNITVPYYSSFRVRVTGAEIGDGIVSFVVPKYRQQKSQHEIVVVKDDFRSLDNESIE